MRFRSVPKSSTLDDFERPIRTVLQHDASFGAHCKNLNEDRPILSAAKCRTMTLVSRNIRYMRMRFLEVGASNKDGAEKTRLLCGESCMILTSTVFD